MIDHRMSLAEAVYAPRLHHQALPDSITWEAGGVNPDVRHQLEVMGHVFRAEPIATGIADVEAIRVTPGRLEGVTDPRIQRRAAAGY